MKIKNSDLLASEPILSQIVFSDEILGKYSFRILNNIEKITPILENAKQAQEAILTKYCIKDKEGKPLLDEKEKISFDSEEQYNLAKDEIEELFLEETEIEIKTIPISALDEVKISAYALSKIKYILEEEN